MKQFFLIITLLCFVLFSCNKPSETTETKNYVKNANLTTIPDVILPEIDTSLINSEFVSTFNTEMQKMYDELLVKEWNKYVADSANGGHGPKAFYKVYQNSNFTSIVFSYCKAGFNTEDYSYNCYNFDTKTGIEISNDSLMQIADVNIFDFYLAFDLVNKKEVGVKNGKIAYNDFDAGIAELPNIEKCQMYMINDSLQVFAIISNLPFGNGTLYLSLPITEMLCKKSTFAANTPSYCYAISDKIGKKFLVASNNGKPYNTAFRSDFSHAIYSSNIYKIKYCCQQKGNEENNNGRDTWRNFDNMEGYIFDNNDNTIISTPKDEYDGVWGPIFLCNEAFIKENKLVADKYSGEPLDKSLITIFEEKYERKIKSAKVSFIFGDNSENKFCSLQFENKGNEALGVYAICTETGIYYLEFPKIIDEYNQYSLWRVDDDGEFFLDNTPVAVFQNKEGFIIKMEDVGFEGYNCYTILLKNGKIEKLEREFSAYTAPM